jgi:predicted transcriptional regulator
MERLTAKEEELMRFFWKNDAWFVKELLDFYDEPRPHFNTLSTIVRGLEEKGFLAHKTYGNA